LPGPAIADLGALERRLAESRTLGGRSTAPAFVRLEPPASDATAVGL
jgi:hypothetical protein